MLLKEADEEVILSVLAQTKKPIISKEQCAVDATAEQIFFPFGESHSSPLWKLQ